MKSFKYRLNGRLPKIGVRPMVDGRRNGQREAVEPKTMILAKAVIDLIENNLRHANGQKVECIMPESGIGGGAEAARCADLFAAENVGATINVASTWCYGAESIDMDPLIPKAIWGFNGSERTGAVYLAGASGASEQKGLPVFKIYSRNVQDADDNSIPEDVCEDLLRFARAALVVALLRGKSYLSMGGVSMGIGGSIVDTGFFQKYLGMRNESIDMVEFVRRMDRNIYDQKEFELALKWTKENCDEMEDPNPVEKQRSREEKNQDWETCVKMTLIARDLMIGNPKLEQMDYKEEAEGKNAIAAGFQGQRQWTDHLPNGDFMEAILNSSFDWNGIRQPFIVATENDSVNAVSMLFGHLLTGTAQLFADVRTFWSKEAIKRVTGKELAGRGSEGFIYLSNSGSAALDGTGQQTIDSKPAIKPAYIISDKEAKACIENTKWGPSKLAAFRGGGFSSAYSTQGDMPFTMVRLNLIEHIGPVLQIAEGYSIELPDDVDSIIVKRTDSTWPRTYFVPNLNGVGAFKEVYAVMKKWASNHCAICYGHIGADLITLSSMLRIPVSMHNVDEEKIMRPSYWDAYGTVYLEAADIEACKRLGPLYG